MDLVLVLLAGFAASLVDGALGMGFGPTSSSLLLGTGLSPAAVATTVNLAKVATGTAGAVAHWRFRNIDHRLVLRLAVPGCLGALVGVTVLSRVDAATIRPVLAALLAVVGLRILWRFSRPLTAPATENDDLEHDPPVMPEFDGRGTEIVAAAGGVTNGMVGAWGPVVTPFLVHRRLEPRFAVGSVNTAEVAVASVSVASLVAAVGRGGLDVAVIVAMIVGGVIAAPAAAWFVRHVPARPMGVAVGGVLVLTNARELAGWADLGAASWGLYAAVGVLVAVAALRPRLAARRAPAPGPSPRSTARPRP